MARPFAPTVLYTDALLSLRFHAVKRSEKYKTFTSKLKCKKEICKKNTLREKNEHFIPTNKQIGDKKIRSSVSVPKQKINKAIQGGTKTSR